MPFETAVMGEKAIIVLQAIADGYTYEQIIAKHPGLTYLDIFSAARDALGVIGVLSSENPALDTVKAGKKTLDDYRKVNPRAYEKWTDEEEEALVQLVQMGHGIRYAAELLQRKPSAVRSRLEKMNLLPADLSP
jgi:hypothetical protein